MTGKNSNNRSLSMVLILLLGILPLFVQFGIFYKSSSDTPENNSDEIINLEISYFNLSAGIIRIDDSGSLSGYLTWAEAANESWCTYKNGVYYIENLTIDSKLQLSCITIFNSNVRFRIKNCTLKNASRVLDHVGIRLNNVSNGVIVNNTCHDNAYGIIVSNNCYNNTILNNIVFNNTESGIYSYGNCENNTISHNTITENDGDGIFLNIGFSNNTIINNVANGNFYGIHLSNTCNNNTISNNTVNNNGYMGIFLNLCYNNTLSNNTVNYNKNMGIRIYNCGNITISNNIANYNGNSGIYLANSNDNLILNNTFNNNDVNGIILYNSNNTLISQNSASYNVYGIDLAYNNNCNITSCTLNNNEYGIRLSECNNVIISDNNETISYNDYGIYLEYTDNTLITRNVINNNNYGIYFLSSSNNNITFNDLINNVLGYIEIGICINNYFSDNNIINRPQPPYNPIGGIIAIIVVVIIIAVIILSLFMGRKYYINNDKFKERKTSLRNRLKKSRQLEAPSTQIDGKAVKSHKTSPLKNVISMEEVEQRLTLEELEEKRMTESEVGVERKEFMCVVHKGEISGPIYLCEHCHTLYCQKCATVLKEKGEKCWSCKKEINL